MRRKGLISQKIIDDYIQPSNRNIWYPSPVVDINKCNFCKTCIDICPIKNISVQNKTIKIDHNKCIRYYCCSEMCPNGAIRLKYSLLGKLVRGGE